MKNKAFIIIAILFTSVKVFSQNYYEINFEGSGAGYYPGHNLYIDTISNPSNIWQIGPPQKTVFTSSVSAPNVIVTDTLTYYPINDTSSFILQHIANLGFAMPADVTIGGKYYVNSDTLTDFGLFEFSPDNGTTWIDLANAMSYGPDIYWNNPYNAPVFTGNSNGWQGFRLEMMGLGPIFNIQYGDTVLWKFTFISDGIQTFKDGLMFDSIYVWDVPPLGIQNVNSENSMDVYPNPFNSVVTLNGIEKGKEVEVFNLIGEKLFLMPMEANQKEVKLDLSNLSKGMYLIKVQMEDGIVSKKIVKEF